MNSLERETKEFIKSIQSLKHLAIIKPFKDEKMPQLTPSQLSTLMLIRTRDGIGIKDIARTYGITSSAATQMVDTLVVEGYVMRVENTKDRRMASLSLSKEIEKHLKRIEARHNKHISEFLGVLTKDELKQYISITKKIVERFNHNKNI